MKRVLVILLTLCMVLSVSGIGAFADASNQERAKWQVETNIPIARQSISCAAVGDKIYVIGKENSTDTNNNVQIYDTKNKTWTTGAEMPTPRFYLRAIALNNKIYVFGGQHPNGEGFDTLEIYDTVTDTWESGAAMPTKRACVGLSVVDGKIYVAGGYNRKPSNAFEVYDPKTNSWTAESPIPSAVHAPGSVSAGKDVYVLGGETLTGRTNIVQIYDTEKKEWRQGKPMINIGHNSPVKIGDHIYAMGGCTDKSIDTMGIYDIKKNTWSQGPSMLAPRTFPCSVAIRNKIYVVGGRTATVPGIDLTAIEVFDVALQPTTEILSVLLNIGETVQLSVSYNLSGNADLTWSSSDEAIATVDTNGKVTASGEGLAYINAKNADETFNESIPVRVMTAGADNYRLALHLHIGQKQRLHLADDSSTVTWTSLDETVVTVSETGEVRAVGKGLAIVQGELESETYQIYVRVNEPVSI